MPSILIYLVIAGVVAVVVCIWAVLLLIVRRKSSKLATEFRESARQAVENLIIDPQSCVYRGADREFGNVKGNGVIALTNKRIMFRKLTGQQIEIDRSQITKVSIENTFKWETAFATGASHLVVETNDGNRIGFLVKNAENCGAAPVFLDTELG
jgi:hypothetical protein